MIQQLLLLSVWVEFSQVLSVIVITAIKNAVRLWAQLPHLCMQPCENMSMHEAITTLHTQRHDIVVYALQLTVNVVHSCALVHMRTQADVTFCTISLAAAALGKVLHGAIHVSALMKCMVSCHTIMLRKQLQCSPAIRRQGSPSV